jgi:hypothetical protein
MRALVPMIQKDFFEEWKVALKHPDTSHGSAQKIILHVLPSARVFK